MNLLTKSFLLVLLLSYSGIRVYCFNQNGIWVGGNIIIDITCPDEVRGEDTAKIDIDIRILSDVEIEYFNIKIEQNFETLFARTLWMNENLGKGFHYVQTLYIGTKETFLSWDLQFNIEAKYKDKYWTYTASPSLVISLIRSRTYDDLKRAYMNLELNFSRLESQVSSLNRYEKAYENMVNDYNSLFWNYTSIKGTLEETQSELNSTKLELENIRSNLNAAYGQIAIWQTATAIAFVVGLITMYVIGKIRRVPEKDHVEMKKGENKAILACRLGGIFGVELLWMRI